ncbi:cobalt-dependent inorganic pyrophosphatase [Andreesenia angusta]|uniref:inorganic diphosphatase n=1 Tax=Andreesenia angusta TaxID=39480 RepID=A0A1S1V7J4_9FIRM|nr:putative manganese-dependent inorganic diphosphatase [Andreesenia angusta]OHW62127.1 cobalt-dependent inorganic pyrophosphatase [Andreesenia angusta]
MSILIFGHKNPDTDSITSAVSLSYLKNKLGVEAKAARIGEINKETEFVLNKFKVESPELISDVKTQVRDLEYEKVNGVSPKSPIIECHRMMENEELTLLPILEEDDKLMGIVSLKDIAIGIMKDEFADLNTSVENVVSGLEGKLLVKGSDEVKGSIVVVTQLDEFAKSKIDSNTVVITSDNDEVVKASIERGSKLIVVTNDKSISEDAVEKAKQNGVSVVSVSSDIFVASKIIDRCNYISSVMNRDVIKFGADYYLDDVKEAMLETKRRTFPVVDGENKFLGLISRNHVINPKNKKVILVDHNEYAQSAKGIEEADIIEVVDHHKIGDISTSTPINFRNMVVGSSCTVIYNMFKESGVEIPESIAGMLISGIVSDTLLFRSPTTTDMDRDAVDSLNKILNLDLESYAMDMFKAGTSLEGFTIEEIFYRDFKEFNLEGNKVGVGQVFTLDIDEIMARKDEYIDFIKKAHKTNGYYITLLALTDIINEGSYILFESNNENIIKTAFDIEAEQGAFVDGLVSRKKQIVPKLTEGFNLYK